LNFTEYIGLMAGLFITFSFIPQLIRVFRLKSAREISILFTSFLLLGMALWLTYGIILGLVPIILWNAVGEFLVILLLYAKIRYGRTAN
jgi:MtN3 and saliva related transmembrane protein